MPSLPRTHSHFLFLLPSWKPRPPTQLALWMGSSLTSSSHPLGGRMGANIGQTLDKAYWSTWAPLDNTGSWREGCGLPSLSFRRTLDPTG